MICSPKKHEAIYERLRQEILTGKWPMGAKLPKEAEMARLLGCSIGTLSKAVGLLVHEGLVERRPRAGTQVLRNTIESAGAAARLDAFAFIYPGEQHEGIWRLVKGFNDAACEEQRRVVMLSTGPDYQKEAEMLGRLSEFDVKGAVIYPVMSSPEDQIHFSQMLLATKFPLVLAEVSLPGLGYPAVVADGLHAGYTMTRHILGQGKKRIGFFSNYSWIPFMRDRYLGYRCALNEAGIPEQAQWVMLEGSMHPDFADPLREPTELARGFLRNCGKLDGVVCANDFLAFGLIHAAREMGIRVPEDLKVTGIDDYAMAPLGILPLTTYRIPYEAMGRKAFERLSEACSQTLILETQLKGSLVVRQSA
ncbi:MAG: LacI family DNA-binding transcriptional regulator [Chthoniobacteraceae bacterium]